MSLAGSALLGNVAVERGVRRGAGLPLGEGLPVASGRREPSVLDLISGGEQLACTAPIGLDEQDCTVNLDLKHPRSHHLVVVADPEGQGEALRSAVAGLSRTTRPALLQLAAIDLSGNELSLIDGVPHCLIESARSGAEADSLLRWLANEIAARREERRAWPLVALALHDVERIEAALGRAGPRHLDFLLRLGGGLGFHMLAGRRDAGPIGGRWRRADVAWLCAGDRAQWVFRVGRNRRRMSLARLPVIEIDQVAGRSLVHGSRSPLAARRRDR